MGAAPQPERVAAALPLLRRAPGLRLTVPGESLRWRRGLVLRGLEALPVTLT